jgi:CheY-like chemotaxis protein
MPPHRIFVVEDDDIIRESLVDLLDDSGYEAVGALHGGEALEKLRTTTPSPCLILLDLMMPVMDGQTFRDRQLQDPTLAGIPIVVMSAHRDAATAAGALRAEAYLTKPLKLDELLGIARRLCPPGDRADHDSKG